MERKYYYISPSGVFQQSKLTRPLETGIYEIGLMVRDEYGAPMAYYFWLAWERLIFPCQNNGSRR
jgi:hypothetical protein